MDATGLCSLSRYGLTVVAQDAPGFCSVARGRRRFCEFAFRTPSDCRMVAGRQNTDICVIWDLVLRQVIGK
jgi:hypothetical protein